MGRLRPLADGARLAAGKPDVKPTCVTFNGGSGGDGSIPRRQRVGLSNRTGHGWPDIVFSENANDGPVAGASSVQLPGHPRLITGSSLMQYSTTLFRCGWPLCMMGKKLECLRNDLGFDVLWVTCL